MSNTEKIVSPNQLLVTKTDPRGVITYANENFVEISGFTRDELIGSQHNIIRHPEMPRAVFKLMWDFISNGNELFAYVKNRCKDSGFYWVLAHVTPTFDSSGQIIGYHSNRRSPQRESIPIIEELYLMLCQVEEAAGNNRRQGLESSYQMLQEVYENREQEFNQYMLSLETGA